jgi:hypothetical protein
LRSVELQSGFSFFEHDLSESRFPLFGIVLSRASLQSAKESMDGSKIPGPGRARAGRQEPPIISLKNLNKCLSEQRAFEWHSPVESAMQNDVGFARILALA